VSTPPLPPRTIPQDSIVLVRKVEGGQVVTHYLDKLSGKEVLPPTFHLGAGSLVDPPPT